MHEPFAELALLLLIAAGVGAIAVRLRQPVLIAYIVVGIAAGPAGFELVQAHDQIVLLAQFGIAVLLFLVGLKLDLPHVRHIGPVVLATGLGQLAFTISIGFVMVLAMGRDWVTALYVRSRSPFPAPSSSSSCSPTGVNWIPCTGVLRSAS